MKYLTIINGEQFEIEIEKDGSMTVNGEPRHVDFKSMDSSLYSMIADNNSMQVVVEEEAGQYSVLIEGQLYEGQVLDERALLLAQRRGGLDSGSGEVNAPMPGLIVKIPVAVGDTVAKGQTVAILESMKMQNELKSPIDGVVTEVKVSEGQTVDKNAALVEIEQQEDEE